MDEQKKETKEKKQTFASKLGYVIGSVIASCVAIVVCSAVIAVAAKIIVGLVQWLF